MLDYKTLSSDDIIEWCKENNQTEWLKKEAAKTTKCKVYPRITVVKTDKLGNVVYKENGEPKTISIADKSKAPIVEIRPISFVKIKQDFCQKFMPEIIPQKDKAATMFDKIAAL